MECKDTLRVASRTLDVYRPSRDTRKSFGPAGHCRVKWLSLIFLRDMTAGPGGMESVVVVVGWGGEERGTRRLHACLPLTVHPSLVGCRPSANNAAGKHVYCVDIMQV